MDIIHPVLVRVWRHFRFSRESWFWGWFYIYASKGSWL